MNNHQMQKVSEFEDGSEEWACPTCGRRFIIHFNPDYHRTILSQGDQDALHVGSEGGVQIEARAAKQRDDDLNLNPFYEFVDKHWDIGKQA